MVSLGQILLFAQLGLPGAFNLRGIAALKYSNAVSISKLLLRRFLPFSLISFLFCLIYRMNPLFTAYVILGYLILMINQWVISSFQIHISNIEYAGWRIMSPLIQLLLIFITLRNFGYINILGFIFCWLISNLMQFIVAFMRYKFIMVPENRSSNPYSLLEVVQLGRSGFLAHIGLADLIKLDILLIPFFQSTYFSAKYFALIGLANWSRVLVDGMAVGYIQHYGSIAIVEAKKKATSRIFYIVLVVILGLLSAWPIGNKLITRVISSKYGSIYPLFVTFSLIVLFSSLRRFYLDAFRSHGIKTSKIANRIEVLSWLISIVPIPILLFDSSIEVWGYASMIANLVALLFALYLGKKYDSIL